MLWNPDPESLCARARMFLEDGLAIEPVLIKGKGEMTNLILASNQVSISCSTHRFIKELCRELFLDLKFLQQFAREKLRKKQLLPVPLESRLVLLPLRSHQPEFKTRGFLWISYKHIKDIEACKHKSGFTELVLSNGHHLLVPYSVQFVHDQVRDATLLDYIFQEHRIFLPHHQRPSLLGHALAGTHSHLHHQLLLIAEALRKYPS